MTPPNYYEDMGLQQIERSNLVMDCKLSNPQDRPSSRFTLREC
jgi:hypothetical protein